MNRPSGGTIAVIIALIFVVASAIVSVGIILHGVHGLSEDSKATLSEELFGTKQEEMVTTSTTRATTTKTTTTKTTPSKKTTTEKTTTKKSTTGKPAAKKTTTEKATTKKTTKKTTAQKADGSKVIYLTFDDGPGPYTDKLLGILEKYDVKATFFVTNVSPQYRGCIAKEYRAGHAVAIHTFSHDYSAIYKSEAAYWRDFNRMNEVIRKQTGHITTLFRFPGGSSNTVSRRYNDGIMHRLVKQARQKGLTYVDWNVYDGDAGETTSSKQVYKNIVRGVKKQKKSVVLCHDVKPYTVNAMEPTIQWCLEHGYTFKVLRPDGFTVHHDVNN
ncbi:MAG: polysaccharide deacetylase [Clostridia bacterium]|nr:polysaccharide deacetylase [Clostridia bacterium]